LENQLVGAKEIFISYDPQDPKIDSFVGQIQVMVKNGVNCGAEIKVEANNYLRGFKLERTLKKLKNKLDMNEAVKGLCLFHANADRQLCEISQMCLGKTDER